MVKYCCITIIYTKTILTKQICIMSRISHYWRFREKNRGQLYLLLSFLFIIDSYKGKRVFNFKRHLIVKKKVPSYTDRIDE